MKTNIGGERLGTGNKMEVSMKNYDRSTHDLSFKFRSSMSAGTLVPFMNELALPGDALDIDLDAWVITLPTVGPLYGSYKIQLDVFIAPIKLYQGLLMINATDIGRKMSTAKLPLMKLRAQTPRAESDLDTCQINPSCILSYLGIKGLGWTINGRPNEVVERDFNALGLLIYWDTYKNYYANKQEEYGAVITADLSAIDPNFGDMTVSMIQGGLFLVPEGFIEDGAMIGMTAQTVMYLDYTGTSPDRVVEDIWIKLGGSLYRMTEAFQNWTYDLENNVIIFRSPNPAWLGYWNGQANQWKMNGWEYIANDIEATDIAPRIAFFPLAGLDKMRMNILTHTGNTEPFRVEEQDIEPYRNLFEAETQGENTVWRKQINQEGLALKTYQADMYNTWLNTEWIDGQGGVNEITAISTAGGSITIDEINMATKIYQMLTRVVMSGGTVEDYLDATYTDKRRHAMTTPMYIGGLSKELTFQEHFSSVATEGQPLGTMASIGQTFANKGGNIRVKVDEPSYIMGIVSLTPRIGYSQGNRWDTQLMTYDDFHKPALDAIGFQDLIADEMAWWTTGITTAGVISKVSIGKQPAWINYMTNTDRVFGNLAIQNQEMFKVLNRRYEADFYVNSPNSITMRDITTYIDPSKYNHIFADTRLDAQNFTMQIKVDFIARRLMSAKVMPNI